METSLTNFTSIWDGTGPWIKIKQGDGATPEGQYKVQKKNGPGETRFFRALLLDYPNPADHREFLGNKRQGRIERHARIGGLIEVHGDGGKGKNWTDGCIALGNPDMEKLFGLAYVGMPVTVVGRLEE